MAANMLNSKRAIDMSIFVVQAFVKLRQAVVSHKRIAREIMEIERKLETHDEAILKLIKTIKELMAPSPEKPKRPPIGFHV